jgi:hypothetical protein
MDLPINDKELDTIVKALGFGGDGALYHKLKLVRELKEQEFKDAMGDEDEDYGDIDLSDLGL